MFSITIDGFAAFNGITQNSQWTPENQTVSKLKQDMKEQRDELWHHKCDLHLHILYTINLTTNILESPTPYFPGETELLLLLGEKKYQPYGDVSFSFVLSKLGMYGCHGASWGWISLSAQRLRGLENVTRANIQRPTSTNRVKNQLWMNCPFEVSAD